LAGGVVIAMIWSAYTDYCFFRSVLRRSPARAARELALHRLVSWILTMAVIGGPTIWSEATGRLW
jgi:hypothetical protein